MKGIKPITYLAIFLVTVGIASEEDSTESGDNNSDYNYEDYNYGSGNCDYGSGDCEDGSSSGVGGGGVGGIDLGTKILCEIILSIIAISGIIGNIISIYVFSRPKMVSSTIYRILIALAIFDTLFLVDQFISVGLQEYGTDKAKPVWYPIKGFAYVCSIYLTVFLSVERYINVCLMKSIQKTYIIGIGAVVLFSVIWNFPKCFEYTFYTTQKNTTSYRDTEFGSTKTYQNGYKGWGYPIVQFFIPILVLIVLNFFLVQKINEMGKDIERRLRQTSENLGDKQKMKNKATSRQVTKTVLVAVNFFLVCNISECIWWLIKAAKGDDFNPPPMFTCWGDFSQVLNSSFNVVIYGVFSERFRDTFCEEFAFLSCKKKQSNQIQMNIVKKTKTNATTLQTTVDSTSTTKESTTIP